MKGGLSGQAAPSGRGRGAPGPGPFRGRRAGHRVGTPAGAAAAEQQADSICLGRRPRSAPGEGSSPGEALPQGSCSPRRSAARTTPTARARVSGSSRAPPRCWAVPGSSALCFLSGPLRRGSPGAARERGGWEGVQEAVALSGGSSAPSPGDGLSQRQPRWLPGGPGPTGPQCRAGRHGGPAPWRRWGQTLEPRCPAPQPHPASRKLLPSSPLWAAVRGRPLSLWEPGHEGHRDQVSPSAGSSWPRESGSSKPQWGQGPGRRPSPAAGVRAGWSPELTRRPNPQSQVVTLFEVSGRRCG